MQQFFFSRPFENFINPEGNSQNWQYWQLLNCF